VQKPSRWYVKKEALFKYLISLIDPKTKETTRVGVRVEGDKKVRFSKNLIKYYSNGVYLD
jgi:large subunit ribosomal protein L24